MRLFVAVNLPAAERQAVWEAAAPLRALDLPVRWVSADALHITLKFLGEVSDGQVPALGEALSRAVAAVRPFDLGLGGFGAFPDLHRPRVVWCGVEQHPALELLANDVERALQPFDFHSDLKPFQPHLTLGRVRRDGRATPSTRVRASGASRASATSGASRASAGLAETLARLDYATVIPVASADLMRSTMAPKGPVYDVQHRATLGGDR